MKYCYECGAELIKRPLKNEGIIPYCTKCEQYRFPIFSTAVSMVVQNPSKDKILLIQQYGKKSNVLVAGYVNRGEDTKSAVIREVKEEIGLDVVECDFNKSEFFEPSNTLMLNFSCVVNDESLEGLNTEEVDKAEWFSINDAVKNIKPNSLAQRFLKSFVDCNQNNC